MKNLWWLGQFGRLRTLLDSSDEGNDVCDNDEDEDYLVQQRSGGNDLIIGSKPRKRNNDVSYKFEEERNI